MISVSDESDRIYPYLQNRWTPKENTSESVRKRGTLIHKQIENYLKYNVTPDIVLPQFEGFLKFLRYNKLSVIELEKRISNNKYTGIIDALFRDNNGKIILVDWKCAYYIDEIGYGFDQYFGKPISNYNKYSYQLHIYNYILKTIGTTVDNMLIVNFNNSGYFEKYEVNEDLTWINAITTGIFPTYREQNFIIPFGIHKNKSLSQIPPKYLDYLCSATVYDGEMAN